MAQTAVAISLRRGPASRIVLVRRLVLMSVMPEMLRGGALLMPAVGAGRRPERLEGQD